MPVNSFPVSSEASKKRRRAITNDEKREIRAYYFSTTHHKRPTLDALQEWYRQKHPHLPVARSSLGEIVSPKYAILDDNSTSTVVSLGAARMRRAQYPDLKAALHQFQV